MQATHESTDVLAVHSIDHFALSVPDLKTAQHFFTQFGLDVRDADHGFDLHTFGHAHRWGVLRSGPNKRLRYLSLLAFPHDIVRFQKHFDQLGIAIKSAPLDAAVNPGGIWIATPDGLPIHIGVGTRNSPSNREPSTPESRFSPERGAPVRGTTPATRPTRLAHVLLFTADLDRCIEFFASALGLRLSDRCGGVAFMHSAHGGEHHLVAFAQSDGYGLHHSAWTVHSVNEVGLGSEQMREAGYSRGWGLGRHVLGSNYFRYVRDPWGSYAEYSFDIDYIPAGTHWETWTPPPENSLYLWGPEVPEDFVHNYESNA